MPRAFARLVLILVALNVAWLLQSWIVQESLGIAPTDRTFLSYLFRGFGWMMDVREQLQQPIIRPVIPPDPGIVPPQASEGIIKDIVRSIHDRLSESNAFAGR